MGNGSSSVKLPPPPPPVSLDQFKNTFDANKNGVNAGVAKTNQDIANSNTNIKTKIDDSNKAIRDQLQTNLAQTKSKLDNSLQATTDQLNLNLALTKQTINYDQLQSATGVISKIVSYTPIGYGALKIADLSSGGQSNTYLKNGGNINPIWDTVLNPSNITNMINPSNILNTLNPFPSDAVKTLEAPFDIGKLNPFQQDTTPQPQPYDPNSTTSKYSSFDSSGQTVSKTGDNLTALIIPVGIGAVILAGLIYTTKKK